MLELLFGVIVLGAVVLVFKVLFLVLGLLFSGIGIIFRVAILGALGFFFFPVLTVIAGGLFSSGFLALLLAAGFLAVLFSGRRRGHSNHYSSEYRDRGRGYSYRSEEW